MEFGIPKETRPQEHRVSLTPSGVEALVRAGAKVWVERGAGIGAGFEDEEYERVGARLAYSRQEVFSRAQVVVCVHGPAAPEYQLLRPGLVVMGFWALPAGRPEEVTDLLATGASVVGYEIIEDSQGQAPVLTSMSEIAGRLAVTIGSGLLLNVFGGKGILFSGVPGVPPANFVVIGAGALGRAAAQAALGMGASVVLLDRSVAHLREAARAVGHSVPTMLASPANIEKAIAFADLVLLAAAIRGERAPLLITRDMLRKMKPRAVLMDLSIDMGGCAETSRPTYFPDPVYTVEGVRHFCVPNLPSVAARSATLALTNTLLPFLLSIAQAGFAQALRVTPELAVGTYTFQGKLVHQGLARVFGLPASELSALLP
ncbi:MAG: alanine dehydrogenase [Thermoanaerobaculum sp.]|nr:alanine dehydrogenase [Thermoanaerobaculum sp.]